MIKIHLNKVFAAVLSLAFLFTSCAKKSAEKNGTRTIIDHDGEQVTIPAELNRIAFVSIFPLPSVTALYLGSTEKFVGIPPASKSAAQIGLLGEMFPDFTKLPSNYINSGSDLNIEELMKLNPDVVFCSSHEAKTKEILKSAGIPAIGFSVNNWDYDILKTYSEWIKLLDQIFPECAKTDKISEYNQQIQKEVAAKTEKIPQNEKKKILFLFQYSDKKIITSGKKFFGQSWCEYAGGVNVAEKVAQEQANAVITMEQIYDWNPDVIFITNFTNQNPEDLYNNTVGSYDWKPVKAVQDKQVYKMPLATYRSYTPSADTPINLLWMAQKVYPELFGDINLEERVKAFFKDMYGIELTAEQIERIYNPYKNASGGVTLF